MLGTGTHIGTQRDSQHHPVKGWCVPPCPPKQRCKAGAQGHYPMGYSWEMGICCGRRKEGARNEPGGSTGGWEGNGMEETLAVRWGHGISCVGGHGVLRVMEIGILGDPGAGDEAMECSEC